MHPLKGTKQSAEHIQRRIDARIASGHAKVPVEKLCLGCNRGFFHSLERVKTCSVKCGAIVRGAARTGKNHPGWKGGSYIDKDGYKMILSTDHPNRHSNNYVAEHHLIMEKMIGRFLRKGEVVHHWDLNRLNNEPENLCLFKSQKAHRELHGFAQKHNLKVIDLKFAQPWLVS